mgnify:FL=1
MFGSLPEEIALKFGGLYGKHIPAPSPAPPSPAPPSPIVVAYRQLREQQVLRQIFNLKFYKIQTNFNHLHKTHIKYLQH